MLEPVWMYAFGLWIFVFVFWFVVMLLNHGTDAEGSFMTLKNAFISYSSILVALWWLVHIGALTLPPLTWGILSTPFVVFSYVWVVRGGLSVLYYSGVGVASIFTSWVTIKVFGKGKKS